MRAVWSFWSKPFLHNQGHTWHHPRHHLMAWTLSLQLARRHFAETMLVTDTPGKRMLVDELGLDFDLVSTVLDSLDQVDPAWWALGKLMAYSLQDRPFVHLDTDVFLWKALPAALLAAPVLAQCPEQHALHDASSGPRPIEHLFSRHGRSLPVEWEWASSRNTTCFHEANCGIAGGNNVDFLRFYANAAIRVVTDPAHRPLWAELPDEGGLNMMVEQFFLAACVEYHRISPESTFRGVHIRYLFSGWDEANDDHAAARVGYTHLLGDAKRNPEVMARLERRLSMMAPSLHWHCERLARHTFAGA